MATRIYYRLSEDANNQHSLWSGAITVPLLPGKAEARRAVAKHLNRERLPERTLVMTDFELQLGDWTADEIRAATTPMADAPTVKRKKKAFADVGMTFDQAEALLKQFGLK
tara:strand:+ start:386 stop:718 length:333 start_codon:yes stop_codon:yes gene_type:complete